jgi:sensor c-di-GMP phosphodiesterase-like protein
VEDGLPDPSSNLPSPSTRRERVLVLILVALAPLILCAVLCYYASERVARREAAITSLFIVNQVSVIIEEARSAVQGLVPHAGDSCEQLMPDLAVAAASAPYVRTINVIVGDHSFCSSAFGNRNIPLGSLKNAFPRVPGAAWMVLVYTTPFVPRQALIIGEPAPDGRTILAVVDDRYFIDLMRAAAPADMYGHVELRFAQSPPLSETGLVAPVDDSLLLADVRKETGVGAFAVRIYGLRSREQSTLRGLLLNYMPWAAALSALLVWLVWRLQHSRSPRREVLLRAMRGNEFHVEYQPIYGVNVGRCSGVEALLRWVRPGRGAVRPDDFIAVAEEEQVIVPLTQHLLKLIARDFATMSVSPEFHVGVNLAPEHLSSEQLIDDIHALRAAMGPRGPRVVVEITERTLIRNTEQAKSNLESLRAEGVQVAIDDFGTGYCSLTYLERFPFDWLKIDRGFVLTIEPGVTRAVVLDAIIDLARSLGAELVAEGVETSVQFDYLRAHGVAYIQGYLYAQPMKPDVFAEWYRTVGSQAFPAMAVPTAQ